MNDMTTLAAMARAARDAASLMPPNIAPGQFDTFTDFRAAFDAVDRPLSDLIRDRLDQLHPGLPWAEELDTDIPAGEVWVVDAVDGAIQYLQGLPQWSVSIALVRDGRPVLAALHCPFLHETYTAAEGGGAFRDGVRVAPSVKTDLSLTFAGTSQPPFPARQPQANRDAGRALTALLPVVGAVRNLGPTSWQVADVGSGRIDVFWEFGRDAANLLAGSLVATEAGARISDAAGEPWGPLSTSFIAAPPALHPQVIQALSS